jgi:hypothetical protein
MERRIINLSMLCILKYLYDGVSNRLFGHYLLSHNFFCLVCGIE